MWIIIGLLLFLIALIFAVTYNRFIVLENRIDNAESQVDVQLKKRHDLVPNLVKTVKGYAKHEKSVFSEVTKARTAWSKAKSVKQKTKAANMLSGALKSLFAVAEAYPDLKANENFLMLQEELSGIENKIAYARQFYNDTVLTFNNKVEQFPSNIIAEMFNFKEHPFFEIEESEKKPVEVNF
ncbi:MAG: hypothetical protein MAG795_00468 [Candidatus Woesearchaeota archaeon]|nr:hypothetical protein [Candidatus Woesearchaeota archaeon]